MGGSLPALSEKESFLLTQLDHFRENFSQSDFKKHISQRELAFKSGLSIGLINAILRRLISSGYVKTKALNKKRIQYLLTSKGVSQLVKRSFQALLNTINRYQQLEVGIHSLIHFLLENGYSQFQICGTGELAEMVSKSIRDHYKNKIIVLDRIDGQSGTAILNLTAQPIKTDKKVINALDYLRAFSV